MTTADIQHLREQTGVGMMDAKRALTAANGDMALAIENLRKTGQKIAASKSARAAKEGVIGVWVADDKKRGALVALACETDFVARTADFQSLANNLAAHLGSLQNDTLTAEQFLDQPGIDGAATVKLSLDAVIAKLGENMQIPSIGMLTATAAGTIDSYLHASRKVATLVAMEQGNADVSHDVAMHVAAMSPRYTAPTDVPADILAKEEEIYRAQLKEEGKPEAMWEKILPGKVKKFFADVCLLDQPFIKDDTQTVGAYVKQSGAAVRGFIRLAI